MHAIFVAMMLTVGADQGAGDGAQPDLAPPGVPGSYSGSPGPYRYDPPRDPKEDDDLVRGFIMYCRAWFQPMPQTCYSPHFGCYPGNGRDIQRYPAFHGYYYRQAYNYRPLFEYPWQAGMHEPLPLELSGERSLVVGPQPSRPQPVEVIETPAVKRPNLAP